MLRLASSQCSHGYSTCFLCIGAEYNHQAMSKYPPSLNFPVAEDSFDSKMGSLMNCKFLLTYAGIILLWCVQNHFIYLHSFCENCFFCIQMSMEETSFQHLGWIMFPLFKENLELMIPINLEHLTWQPGKRSLNNVLEVLEIYLIH